MKKYRNKTPEEVMKMVTTELIERAIQSGTKKNRSIFISKTSGGKGIDVQTLNPKTSEGKINLENFLRPVRRHYTISGLGSQEEPDAINWRVLNLPLGRRIRLVFLIAVLFFLKGTPGKNKIYRRMGVHVGKDTEIMQMVWLDHFRPELIFIGENTLVGAFSRLSVHGYEGSGKFRYGLIEIGNNCTIGAGTGIGPIKIEDNVRTLPNTTLSPYLSKIKAGSIVGWNPPSVKKPDLEDK
ncbi:MAG: DapH/DapD/GlmU-related protein [Thermodesulfobacteriota bacterium]|jgi:acetyltransferase-like isoleucine patch superfamily enzyme